MIGVAFPRDSAPHIEPRNVIYGLPRTTVGVGEARGALEAMVGVGVGECGGLVAVGVGLDAPCGEPHPATRAQSTSRGKRVRKQYPFGRRGGSRAASGAEFYHFDPG